MECLIVPECHTGVEKRQYFLYLGKSKHKSPTEFCLTNDTNIHAQDDICTEDVQFSRLNILINYLTWKLHDFVKLPCVGLSFVYLDYVLVS